MNQVSYLNVQRKREAFSERNKMVRCRRLDRFNSSIARCKKKVSPAQRWVAGREQTMARSHNSGERHSDEHIVKRMRADGDAEAAELEDNHEVHSGEEPEEKDVRVVRFAVAPHVVSRREQDS